jgi:hypothetical protein
LSATDSPTAIPNLPLGVSQSWVAVSQNDIGRSVLAGSMTSRTVRDRPALR